MHDRSLKRFLPNGREEAVPPAILFAAAIGAAILGQYDLAAWCAAAFILSLAALAIGA